MNKDSFNGIPLFPDAPLRPRANRGKTFNAYCRSLDLLTDEEFNKIGLWQDAARILKRESDRAITRRLSDETFRAMQYSGGLSANRLAVYNVNYRYGPITQRQTELILLPRQSSSVQGPFSALGDMGLIKVIDEILDPTPGGTNFVALYDITGRSLIKCRKNEPDFGFRFEDIDVWLTMGRTTYTKETAKELAEWFKRKLSTDMRLCFSHAKVRVRVQGKGRGSERDGITQESKAVPYEEAVAIIIKADSEKNLG